MSLKRKLEPFFEWFTIREVDKYFLADPLFNLKKKNIYVTGHCTEVEVVSFSEMSMFNALRARYNKRKFMRAALRSEVEV